MTGVSHHLTTPAVRNVVIVGGGTSGWMCAAAIARIAPPQTRIRLVESKDIGVVGVGEATIPAIMEFNRFLGIDERDLLRECNGTFKLGIDFVDWYKQGETYFHPFGSYGRDTPDFPFHQLWLRLNALSFKGGVGRDAVGKISDYNLCAAAARLGKFAPPQGSADTILSTMRYAYHFDSASYGTLLRRYAQQRKVERVEGTIIDIKQDKETGLLRSLRLQNNHEVSGDFFIDCSGFKSLLLGDIMGSEFIDWRHFLPCDSAIAVQAEQTGAIRPFTRATADSAGWRWQIPLQSRTGNGHVYSSQYMAQENALSRLLNGLEGAPISEPLAIKFRTGHRSQFWKKNCVAIGLAGGFIEPLESTSIHLTQMGIQRLVNLWPGRGCNEAEIGYYNQLMVEDYERLRDFIVLHYHATERDDSEFWRYVKQMPIPDSLASKLAIFRHCGRVVTSPEDLFTPHSWLAVMTGQGILPDEYDWLVDRVPKETLLKNMHLLQTAVSKTAGSLPLHENYIKQYCAGY